MVDERDKAAVHAAHEEQLNRVFRSLSDPSRRAIIALLREASELKVGDIAAAFDMSLNGVSKHLKVLESAGLVVRRVEGRTHWIRVQWQALQAPYEFLHFYHHFWSERLDALIDYVRDTDTKTTTDDEPKKGKTK